MRGRRRRKKKSETNRERWLVSYADFITLLFAFFTSMYAISSINEGKFNSLSGALSDAFSTSSNNSVINLIEPLARPGRSRSRSIEFIKKFSQRYQRIMLSIKKSPVMKGIGLHMEKDRIVIRIPGGTLFTSGGAALVPGAEAVLDELARTLKGIDGSMKIEGHTDNVPTRNSNFSSNWDLSSARAITVLKFFVNRHGFDPAMISATGYGEYRPIDSNDTPYSRRINRRLDIVLKR